MCKSYTEKNFAWVEKWGEINGHSLFRQLRCFQVSSLSLSLVVLLLFLTWELTQLFYSNWQIYPNPKSKDMSGIKTSFLIRTLLHSPWQRCYNCKSKEINFIMTHGAHSSSSASSKYKGQKGSCNIIPILSGENSYHVPLLKHNSVWSLYIYI